MATCLKEVTPARCAEWQSLAANLGLDDFDPTTVNWDKPVVPFPQTAAERIMPLGAGLAIEIGFGVFFSFVTVLLTYLETKFAGTKLTSEHFNTAGRDVKTGLTASVIVSQWTWAATLLQSSNVAWRYGITGPFWYASGASIQVLVFGILAIEVKRKASNAHTFLEMINVRWGKAAHVTFFVFGIMTNIIVSSMLLLGGCAVMNSAAGIDIRLSGFLIPLGTLVYTLVGGLKATFLASYLHTTIIFIGLVIMVTLVYGINSGCDTYVNATGHVGPKGSDFPYPESQCNSLGSASLVYERLKFLNALPTRVGTFTVDQIDASGATVQESFFGFHQGSDTDIAEGNRGGSYLTFMSTPGFMFGIINIVGNFGTVFVDQSYWQSAIAASPASAHKGYLLGGLVWFTIPFTLATSLGLAANALNVAITSDDANAGLVPPAAAAVLVGRGGAVLMIIMLFMAITSTGSAECIAVSSLYSYDFYRCYINPNATGKDILFQSRIMVAVWALLMFFYNWILWGIGVSLGWVYNFMGIMIGSAVFPVAMVICWSRMSATAAICGAWGGMILAVTSWLIYAGSVGGAVNVDTTGILEAQLTGNCVALGSSVIISSVISLIAPQNYEWSKMNEGIKLVEDANTLGSGYESTDEFLMEAKAWIMKYGVGWTFFLIFVWPAATIPWGVFNESIYSLWASIAISWGYLAAIVIILAPIVENWTTVRRVLTCDPVKEGEATSSSATKEIETSNA